MISIALYSYSKKKHPVSIITNNYNYDTAIESDRLYICLFIFNDLSCSAHFLFSEKKNR